MSISKLSDLFNSFFQVTDACIVFVDQELNVIDVNKAFTNFTRYDKDDMIGVKFMNIIAEQDRDEVKHLFNIIQPCARKKITCLVRKKNSSVQSVILEANGLVDLSGSFIGYSIQINLSNEHDLVEMRSSSDLESTISKFSTLIDNSRDVLYSIYYKEIRFEYLSPSVVELTGFTRDELLGMTPRQMLKIIHPDFRRMYFRYWNTFKERINRQNHTIEYKIRPKLGISRWLSDNHKIILDEHGEILKLVGNIRDVTDFKLVEEALNRSRDRLFKAIEATNDGMWDWRINVNKVYFDARFYTMLGYEPLEFPAAVDEWMNRIHPEEIEQVKAVLNQHLEGKSDQWAIEYRFLAKNGDWVWVLNKGKIFEKDDNGRPLRMVGTHSDISLRKQAEEELHKRNEELQTIYDQLQISEEKFRQLAENTQDVFWLRDKDKIIYINPSFDKVWGRNHEEVFSNPSIIREWVHPEDYGYFDSWLNFDAFELQKSYIEQYRIIKPDGETRWIWSRMFPIYDDEGKVYRLAGIASDITDQKLVEEALIAAKEKALESDHLKSAFLANISHEIRTPMNGIIGFAELLKDDNLSLDNRIQYVNVITKSSEQLLHIIDDIIDISKIEANQLKINYTNVKISTLLAELQLFYENEKNNIGKTDVELKAEVSPSIMDTNIITDETRLRQILMNLISNALKFTEKGYVKFGASLRQDNYVEFFVQDTGIGIPSDRQSLIFKRFRQLDDTFTRRFGGTGLGLAICEGLVKLLGGQIWVNSEVNRGAAFYFSVPAGENVTSKSVQRKESASSSEYNWAGKTILVVEDDEINQEFLIAVLTPTNATIITSGSGEEAVIACENNANIDLVLMDIRLPKMNGYQAFESIRKIRPNLHVIAQTAFAMTEDATRCIEFGFSEYISKPINRKILLSMINKLLFEGSNKDSQI